MPLSAERVFLHNGTNVSSPIFVKSTTYLRFSVHFRIIGTNYPGCKARQCAMTSRRHFEWFHVRCLLVNSFVCKQLLLRLNTQKLKSLHKLGKSLGNCVVLVFIHKGSNKHKWRAKFKSRRTRRTRAWRLTMELTASTYHLSITFPLPGNGSSTQYCSRKQSMLIHK